MVIPGYIIRVDGNFSYSECKQALLTMYCVILINYFKCVANGLGIGLLVVVRFVQLKTQFTQFVCEFCD